jgi:hypothetical protein
MPRPPPVHVVMRAVLAAEFADAGLRVGQDRDLWLLIHGCRLNMSGPPLARQT